MLNFNDLPLLLPLMAGYAELHYHLTCLYPAYYRKQPEIIADLPHRLDLKSSPRLPMSIIVKDANLFPVHIYKVTAQIMDESGNSQDQQFILDQFINTPWFSKILYIDVSNYLPETNLKINVQFQLKIKNKPFTLLNDNFPGISKKPFDVWLAEKALNLPDNWYAGDPHYHSQFTSDQVEFGADIKTTAVMAKALGLSWFCVTDHSYDLDDSIDDYIVNDPLLPKWQMMQEECKQLDSPDLRIIPGEEVSIGNAKGQNVHMLALNHSEFIEGYGDSAEIWGKNKPQHYLSEIPDLHSKENLFIAAHPLDKVPFMQKLTLNRGDWALADYQNSRITHLQLINFDEPKTVEKNIKTWTNYLLQGLKYFVLAGNDAHGNFNVMRQIKIPFLTLWETRKQIFGNWITIFNSDENDPVSALKTGRFIVSNGPFISFHLAQLEDKWQMGNTCPLRHATVEYQALSSPQFGEIDTIYCYRGDINTGKEFQFPVACPVNIALPKNGYIRMSIITSKGYLAFTNPVFTHHSSNY